MTNKFENTRYFRTRPGFAESASLLGNGQHDAKFLGGIQLSAVPGGALNIYLNIYITEKKLNYIEFY